MDPSDPKSTMKGKAQGKQRRVAISLELDWGFKRHLEVYAGCQRYADEVRWECAINPAVDRALKKTSGEIPYDGVIARATKPMADAAKRTGVPLVNVWMNTPVNALPSVLPDFEASGVMAAEHLLGRGFRHFGFCRSGVYKDCVTTLRVGRGSETLAEDVIGMPAW